MEFQRIDDETVRCFVSEEDLKEQGIEMVDFIKNKDKVHGFLNSLIERAREEVGYKNESGVLSMQVVPLPNDRLAITFSEGEAEENIQEMLGSLKDIMDDESIMYGEFDSSLEEQSLFSDETVPDEEKTSYEDASDSRAGGESTRSIHSVFAFESLEQVIAYVRDSIDKKNVISSLYKCDKEYYLIINKGKLSTESYRKICERAMEYSERIYGNKYACEYITEHYECILKKNALNALMKLI